MGQEGTGLDQTATCSLRDIKGCERAWGLDWLNGMLSEPQ